MDIIKLQPEIMSKKIVPGFPTGVQYYGPPHTGEDDWQRDFPLIKEQGLDIIVIWAIWGHLEPSPNQYDFTAWDRLFDVAHAHGLKIIPNTTIEIQPYWIQRHFPGSSMVDQRGSEIVSTTGEYTGGLSPGACLDQEEPRQQAINFLTAFASHFKDRENLFGWDAWCEFRWQDNADDRTLKTSIRIPCYCRQTTEKFRAWLNRKYGSLEGLNARWRHKHTDWADVYPPRGGWWSYGYPESVDWRQFRIINTVDKLQMRFDAIRRGDPKHFIMNHTGSASVLGNHLYVCGSDDWENTKIVDVYGTSFYPAWSTSAQFGSAKTCMGLDGLRSAAQSQNTPLWISELQGGPSLHSPGKGNNYSADDLKFWSYCTLAHGVKGMLYWSWRPEPFGPETLGFGITTYGGRPTDRTRMVKEVVRTVRQHESLLAGARVYPAQAAILFDPDTYIINENGGTGGMIKGMALDSVLGYYKALWQNDILCDFVHSADLDNLAPYKLLILPFAFCLRENVAEAVKTFVQAGGTVISEAYLGRYSEGCVPANDCPAYGLDTVFQVKSTEAIFIDQEPILPAGDQTLFTGVEGLLGYWYKEQPLLLAGAEVLAEFADGTPALTRSHAGAGQTLLFGALMGYGYHEAQDDNSLAQLMANIAHEAGVFQPARATSTTGGLVRVRILQNGNDYLVFCLNYGEACSFSLELFLPSPMAVSDWETGQPVPYILSEDKTILDLQLSEKHATVLLYTQLQLKQL